MPLRQLDQRLKRRWAIRTADLVLVVASALTTASLALVVEDLLPKSEPDALFDWKRGVGLALAVSSVLGSLSWRARARRANGTLFYVQMLDENMADQRLDALDKAAKKRLSRRSITRWLDLEGCMSDGVIDVVEPCQEAGYALEELVNNDRDDTANTVAPNALWPMAVALGMHLPADSQLKVTELPIGKGRDQEFQLKGDAKIADLFVHNQELDEPTGYRVGIWLAFTPARKDFSVDGFRQFGVRTAYTVTEDGVDPADGIDRRFGDEELPRTAAGITEKLLEIKEKHQDTEVVVVAMISKAVAIAVGWQLAQREKASLRNTHLMHFDWIRETYVPMRVRRSQPTTSPVVEGSVRS